MRFLFNDSGIKILTYPEVEFSGQKETRLFNYQQRVQQKSLFENLFQKIIWVSYRRSFSPIYRMKYSENGAAYPDLSSKKFTSDCGWGCMIRCAQMMLSNTFSKLSEEGFLNLNEQVILRKFLDVP